MLGELITAVHQVHGRLPSLTVIDTLSKTFADAKIGADTFSDLYRYWLLPMGRAKMTVAYLDHSGKDPGARPHGHEPRGPMWTWGGSQKSQRARRN